jgi:hypothetical protein
MRWRRLLANSNASAVATHNSTEFTLLITERCKQGYQRAGRAPGGRVCGDALINEPPVTRSNLGQSVRVAPNS